MCDNRCDSCAFNSKEKVVAIVSGGMDSVTMLKMLVDQGKDVLVMNFSYGSKHNEKERAALQWICREMGLNLYTYDLPIKTTMILPSGDQQSEDLLVSNLLKSGEDIPDGHYEEENMRKTVVPFRNGIMLSIAVGFAESHGALAVYYGNHAGDHVIYNDCRPEFVQALDAASIVGTCTGIQIRSPFAAMTKTQIAKLGMRIGAPLDIAWTCYKGGDRPCGTCSTCVERIEAFWNIGIPDPQLDVEEWEKAVTNMKAVVSEYNKRIGK